jgi:hypothetical protein
LKQPYLSKQKALFALKERYHAPPLTGGGLSNQGQSIKLCLNFQHIVFFFIANKTQMWHKSITAPEPFVPWLLLNTYKLPMEPGIKQTFQVK